MMDGFKIDYTFEVERGLFIVGQCSNAMTSFGLKRNLVSAVAPPARPRLAAECLVVIETYEIDPVRPIHMQKFSEVTTPDENTQQTAKYKVRINIRMEE